MSIGSYQGLPEGVARGTLHDTDFFEVLLIEAAQGHLLLDRQVISLKPNTMVFITPFQKRQWFVEGNQLHARYLIFQENFLNDFFSDKLFSLFLFSRNYNGILLFQTDFRQNKSNQI